MWVVITGATANVGTSLIEVLGVEPGVESVVGLARRAPEESYLERVLDGFEGRHPEMRVVRLRPGFIFKREASSEQRRLFAGPLLPNALVRSPLVPVIPDLPGLRFQALHAPDAAEAYRLSVIRPVRGAFNVAADPTLDAHTLGELLSLPVMDTSRAQSELGWSHRVPRLRRSARCWRDSGRAPASTRRRAPHAAGRASPTRAGNRRRKTRDALAGRRQRSRGGVGDMALEA